MARAAKTVFVCQNCGATAPRWAGKCASCEEWNTLVEETDTGPPPGSGLTKASKGRAITLESLKGSSKRTPRIPTGLEELDRVTGGGLVPGSALLIGGEPGIGKSTLLLQLASAIAQRGGRSLYFSGEEAIDQVRLRAERLGLAEAPVGLAAETHLSTILATLDAEPSAQLIVIDSIQTLWSDTLEAAPGTVSQVRAATQSLIRHAKRHGATLLLVGHVTKEGQIAGPKVIEHMVDTVLYFEGESGHPFRILRAVKNRFGPTDEIGVFEMAGEGLRQVKNPSELFLGDRDASAPGTAVFAGIEGTRPLLVEIQALVAPSALGTPRRAVVGWDSNRLSMLLAVLDARCGVSFAQNDVYLNVAGGLKITEPAADLAAAAALLSSFSGKPLPPETVYFGEISLSGAVRAAANTAGRLKESQKLGFSSAVIPALGEIEATGISLDLSRLSHLKMLAERVTACD
ncbi:DNA repair protein RadA homolog [Candidatus Filomicrobium marinum]|uniref:DNA repair protein RadA n=2 Tax=Filomicrobium TaxID=119044 RepID=A0A0D6JI98_9HYPH|nr:MULTISPECIES: DNA repair protein RadA [Filomicrobium]MCV0371520.1 DNA repair protein RadA [Filomicrobium sp.]CFX36996.1 DNA repair protein RadA homolog [Candidatus Filomicrobium marinum]CPR21678.1 DNA repair protein RadA homolog [Candidatus Filomicrobium marinum]SDP62750.1 DNA replication and repair protein RadA [Filomicrobium insigne]